MRSLRDLNATLPARPDWKALADEARPAREEIASLLDSYTPSENEAQVEEELVRPVLRLLGHTFEVQPALATPEGTKRPDYVLYKDAGSVTANKGKALTDELLKESAFAVADAKYWERPLDVSLKGRSRDAFSNKNPSVKIGKMLTISLEESTNPRYIINFPTKRHWREKTRVESVREGLEDLLCKIARLDIRSIAVSSLGCGNGRLDWEAEVRPLIEAAFARKSGVHVYAYEPSSTA